MSRGAGRTSLVALVVVLGCAVWFGADGSGFPGAEAAAPKTSLCDKLPGWCEKQAVASSDRPRDKIQDKMAETRWRKKKGGGVGGHLSPEEETERGKPKIEDKLWFRKAVASRPSRHSEDWKSRLKTDRFHDEDEEDMWEVDDEEDYIKVEDESEEEVEETAEEESEEGEESEEDEDDDDSVEEEDEDEDVEEEDDDDDDDGDDEDEDEDESEEEFDEEEDEDVSEVAGIFKKRWGFDEDQEVEDSEEIIRKTKLEEHRKRMEDEAKRRKIELEQAKKDLQSKKKALEQEAIRKINEERKKKIEEERRKKREEEELKKQKEDDERKAVEEQKKKELEVKKKELEEERRRKIYEERKRKVEEEWKKRDEEKKLKEAEEERKKQEELKREEEKRKEEDEKRRKINEERRKRVEEEKLRKEAEDRQREEEEELKQKELERKREEEEKIMRDKEEAKKKIEDEKRQRDAEEAERKRAEEQARKEAERLKKEEARKEAERLKKEEARKEAERLKKEEARKEAERLEKEEARKEAERLKKEEARKEAERRLKKEEDRKEAERLKKEEARQEAERLKKEEEKRKREQKKLDEEMNKREEKEKKKQTDEETKQRGKDRSAEDDSIIKDQAQKAKQQQVEPSKAQKEKEEKSVKEPKGKKKEEDEKVSKLAKGEDALTTKSKTKSKRKADKIPISEWSPDFPEFFAPTANDEVQNEECKKQSRIYVQHLRRMRTWALQMYDATAKLPSGILSGNVNQLGDFDECLGVDVHLRARGSTATADTSPAPEQLPEDSGTSVGGLAGFLQRVLSWGAALVKAARGASGSEVVHIRGRYCLASVDVDVLPDPRRTKADHAALHDAVQKALSYRFLRGSINDTQHFVPRFSTVSWGLCVPAVCSAQDVEDGLASSIRNWELGDESWGSGKFRFQLDIPDEACRIAPQQPAHKRLPPSFFFVIGGLGLLVLLTLIATLKDQGEADEDMAPERRMLIAFSLRRSWAVLTAPDDVGPSDIHCMHGLRAVCSLALYMAHKVIPAASAPYSNRGKLTQAALSPLSLLLRSSVVYTDTFLLLSGALSSFHFNRELSRTGSLAWRDRYVARLFRLTPPLLAVLLYYSFVMEHIGNGPRWGPLVEANARLCRKNMWRNLLYVQNFFPFKEMCAPQTHQLALDVQLSLLSAPLVWLLNYSPIFASPVILVLQAASAWLRHRTALQHRVALLIYHGQKPSELYRAADLSYALAPHRATAYLVGIALGYALHKIKKPLKLPKILVIIVWIASAALAGWAIFGLRGAATKDFKFDANQVATFNAFAPLAWAVAISWVIMACHADLGGIFGRMLSSRVLLLLSRISYAFYLTQFIVFFHNAGSARSQAEFSVLGVLDLWEFVTVLAISTIFTLLIDLPVQAVRAAFHHKAGPKHKNHTKKRRSKHWDGNNELTWSEKEE